MGSRFRKGSGKAERDENNVQEEDGKNKRPFEVVPSNSTREWNIGPHRSLQGESHQSPFTIDSNASPRIHTPTNHHPDLAQVIDQAKLNG